MQPVKVSDIPVRNNSPISSALEVRQKGSQTEASYDRFLSEIIQKGDSWIISELDLQNGTKKFNEVPEPERWKKHCIR